MFYCENCYLLNEENTWRDSAAADSRVGQENGRLLLHRQQMLPVGREYHGILKDDHIPVIIRQWSPRTAAYTGEVGTRTDFFVPYSELDHARQLEQALMDSSFEQPD